MALLIPVQFQCAHVLVRRQEGALELAFDLQGPVEVKRVLPFCAKVLDLSDPRLDLTGDQDRIVDDHLVQPLRLLPQGLGHEPIDLQEVIAGALRAGKDQREGDAAIVRVKQHAQYVEDLFGGTHPTGEDHDGMAGSHEGLQALLDVGHDHQFVDDGVRRLCGDDPRLRDPKVLPVAQPLLGVADGSALHRPLHGPRAAPGADVEAP